MRRKRFLYWLSVVLGIFLIFFGGGNLTSADTVSDVNSAISTGLTEIAQQGSQIDAWDATCLVFGDNGITDLQAQYAYKSILKNNDFLSGGSQGLNGISDVSAVNGLVAIGKDPADVNGKNLIADVIKDANNPASDYSIVNDLQALSTGSYGQATAAAKSDALNLVDQILATYVSKLSADSTSSAAIADRVAGVMAFNHVTVSHAAPATPVTPPTVTNNNVTVVNNPASSSSASSSSSATSTSSSSSVPISTPTVSGKPVKKASHRSIVYALTTVKLYRSSNFTKSNLTKTYKKRARINRPMFLVISQQTNKQGHAIYRVKDTNSGKTGYTLSGSKYFAHAYYSEKVTRIKVINPKGINEYGKKLFSIF